jgi:hypothetical protein
VNADEQRLALGQKLDVLGFQLNDAEFGHCGSPSSRVPGIR